MIIDTERLRKFVRRTLSKRVGPEKAALFQFIRTEPKIVAIERTFLEAMKEIENWAEFEEKEGI